MFVCLSVLFWSSGGVSNKTATFTKSYPIVYVWNIVQVGGVNSSKCSRHFLLCFLHSEPCGSEISPVSVCSWFYTRAATEKKRSGGPSVNGQASNPKLKFLILKWFPPLDIKVFIKYFVLQLVSVVFIFLIRRCKETAVEGTMWNWENLKSFWK